MHDGRLNQYTIWVNGVKQILLPLVEKFIGSHCTTVRVCLVEDNKFTREMKEENVFYALIPRNTEKQDELEHEPEIGSLLANFQNIISNNVPNGLPRMRSISHCMNLIPRASFPNKAPHRLTPDEKVELNIQVQELLEKGLIREILSSYALPIVLEPKKNR